MNNHTLIQAQMDKVLENDLTEIPKVLTEVERLIKTGNWGYFSSNFDQNTISLYNKEEITCKYVNPAAGIDKILNFGRFVFEFNYVSFYWNITPLNNCINTNCDTLHPHMTRDSICWGNISNTVGKNLQKDELFRVFTSLNELLTVYCPNNPYQSFTFFERKRNNRIGMSLHDIPDHVKTDLKLNDEHTEDIPF